MMGVDSTSPAAIAARVRQWLGQKGGKVEESVTGDYDYQFTFRLEGGGFFQTGVVVASGFTPTSGMPIPLKCRWFRKIEEQAMEIPGVTSNMYQVSADDVGAVIMVEAQPADQDDGWSGIARGQIGPFELDPSTRRALDNALGVGSGCFPVFAKSVNSANNGSSARQDFNIQASPDGVKVVPILGGVERTDKEFFGSFSLAFPRVVIHTLDTTRFQLVLGEGRTLYFHAPSRTARDLIALTIRCFHMRRFLPADDVLRELLPVQPMMDAGRPASSPAGASGMALGPGAQGVGTATGASHGRADSRLPTCIVIERLLRELNRAMAQKEMREKVLRNTTNEKKQLQEQLTETISGFTEVVEGLQQQCTEGAKASCPSVTFERLQAQFQEVEAQNRAAEAEIQALKKQLHGLQGSRQDAEQQHTSAAAPVPVNPKGAPSSSSSATHQKVEELREEHKRLQAQHLELSSSSSASVRQQDQADQEHALELKRLRQDVEDLHNKKEELRRQLQEADKERQDLQDNFLFVKGQHDKVQMRQAQVEASGMTDADEELQRLQESLHNLTEERSRLAARLELVCRDLEKEKAYHEQSIERLMAASSRIMEERDRAEKDVRSVSQLYAEAVKQLQQHTAQGGGAAPAFRLDSIQSARGEPSMSAEDLDEIKRLKADIAQAELAIKQKELENDSLKTRIRKLAVAA